MRLRNAVGPVVVAAALVGGCGEPPAADRGPRDVAERLAQFVKERTGGPFTGVRCRRDFEYEYRCTGDLHDPLMSGPGVRKLMTDSEKETRMSWQELDRMLVKPMTYVARFDPRAQTWSYKRLCERCR